MNMNIVTLPKRGLKTRPYSMDMNKDIVTLPKKGLKTRQYNIGMEKMDLKTRPYSIDMEKKDLKKLTKGQLIKLLLKQQAQKHEDIIQPIPPPRTGKWENVKPKPVPRKSVKQMVKEYEDIIQPPEQFRDGYKPIKPPRTGKWANLKPKPIPRENIILPPKQFRDKPRRPGREPPLPPTNDGFNFYDDIFQTENTSLGKFKIISVQSRENKKFKSYTNEFKVKILKKLDDVKEIYHIFQELVKTVKRRRKLSDNDMFRLVIQNEELPNAIATRAITKNRNDISRPPARLRQTLTFVFRHFHRISFQRGQYSIVILKLLD